MKENIVGYCLITGASQGIGRALAIEWASRGVSIIAVSNDGPALDNLKSEIELNFYNVKCEVCVLDLLSDGAADKLLLFCNEKAISVQILINNVGIGCVGDFENSNIDFDLKVVKLNIFPMLQLTKVFLHQLKSFEQSYVLNMSSLGNYSPVPYKATYSASKSFVYSFTRALASELIGEGVFVSVSCPAGVYTNDRVVQRINRSGRIARWTSLSVDDVSSYIVDGMLRKKSIIIPGFGAKILLLMMRLVPGSINRRIIAKNMKKI